MDQLTVVGRKGIAHDLLTSLQSLGVVQVDPLEPSEALELNKLELSEEDRATKETWDALVAKSDALINTMGVNDTVLRKVNRADAPSDPQEMRAQLDTVAKQVDELVAERGEIRDDLDVVSTYLPLMRDVAPDLAQFDDSRFLYASAFVAPAENIEASLEQISEALGGNVAFQTRPRDKEVIVIAAVLNKVKADLRSAISRAGLSEIVLPERYADEGVAKASHRMEERSQNLPRRLDVIDNELDKLAKQHGAKVAAIRMVATNHQSRFERLEDMAAGRYSFALQGWMPSAETSKVVEGLKRQFGSDIVLDTRNADEHHDHNVPVKLDNPDWVKPFEGLLSLFAPPKYGSFDPAWTMAVFFPFFFGLVVGDMGFALLFAGIAWWMRRRGQNDQALDLGPLGITINPGALKPISTVILWCAAWSCAFGLLYGEFFGNFLEHWPEERPIFYVPAHLEHAGAGAHGEAAHAEDAHGEEVSTDLSADVAETPEEGVSLSEVNEATEEATHDAVAPHDAQADEGAVVDTHGVDTHSEAVAADNHAADDHAADDAHAPKRGIFPIALFRVENYTPLLIVSLLFGILQVVGGWGIRLYYGLRHGDMKHVYESVGMIAGLVALIIYATAYLTTGANGFVNFLTVTGLLVFLVCVVLAKMPLMLVELLSNGGNILSYLRLFAVGLSAALVANLATQLGFAVSDSLPIIGPILGILVGLSVHLIALALTIIGHTLQPLRLNYVEFFTKFGFYDENGRPYQPFRLLGGKA